MDIKKIILRILNKKGAFKASEITAITGYSRETIHRAIRELLDEKTIAAVGKARNARYIKAENAAHYPEENRSHRILHNSGLSEDRVWDATVREMGGMPYLNDNVKKILAYAFMEMLNNAIEHSGSPSIDILVKKNAQVIQFAVRDWGVGVFRNIARKKGLTDIMEAIGDLLKGKETTLPEIHSGEGIFFTSRIADRFIIKSETKKLVFDNSIRDVFIKDNRALKGTEVQFSIALGSGKELQDVFRSYTNDSFSFTKTGVTVRLYKNKNEYYSRSQARRILSGLEKFKHITLDYAGVETVGQAFADEIYRVWKGLNPGIEIASVNDNENVRFMINRAAGSR